MKHSTCESNLNEFIESINSNLDFLASTPVFRGDLFPRPANLIKIFDFFANTHTPRLIERDISKFKSETKSEHKLKYQEEDQLIKSKSKSKSKDKDNYGSSSSSSSIFNSNNNNNNNRRVYKISFNDETNSNSTNRQLIIIYTIMCITLFYYLLKPSKTLKK